MKRVVLLVGLSAFALGSLVFTQGSVGAFDATDGGQPPVAVVFNPSTGKLLFAEDIAPLSFFPVPTGPGLNPLGIELVATVSRSIRIASAPNGFDMDHDGAREFILRKDLGDLFITSFEVWEYTSPGTYQLVHTLDIGVPDVHSSYNPYDTGDADEDGLADLAVFGRTVNDFYIRAYESTSTTNYPTEVVWELPDGWWAVGAKIEDTDDDGAKEIVVAGQTFDQQRRVAIYENDGDNSYTQTFFQVLPDISVAQSMDVANDLDGDGNDEIFFGGVTFNNSKVYAFEATSDNTYQQIWSTELIHSDGQFVNVEFIRDAGDLDGDGKKELLIGGIKTVPEIGYPWFTILYLFEAQFDDSFEVVTTLSLPRNILYHAEAEVGDINADGKKEILLASGEEVAVYQNTGDNSWEQVWASSARIFAAGAGDHDGDGAQEFIFRQAWIHGHIRRDPSGCRR